MRHFHLPQNKGRELVRHRGGGRGRGRQSHDPRDVRGDRRGAADGLRRRADGALHAADPDRRERGDVLVAADRVHRHAVGGRSAFFAGGRSIPSSPKAARRSLGASSGQRAPRGFLHATLSPRDGAAHPSPRLALDFPRRHHRAVVRRDGHRRHRLGEGENAALRQQERVSGDPQHARRAVPGTHRRGGARDGRRHRAPSRRSPTIRSMPALRRPSISTAWCATTSCAAARMSRTSR